MTVLSTVDRDRCNVLQLFNSNTKYLDTRRNVIHIYNKLANIYTFSYSGNLFVFLFFYCFYKSLNVISFILYPISHLLIPPSLVCLRISNINYI